MQQGSSDSKVIAPQQATGKLPLRGPQLTLTKLKAATIQTLKKLAKSYYRFLPCQTPVLTTSFFANGAGAKVELTFLLHNIELHIFSWY